MMRHVIPKQLGPLNDAEKQVVLLPVVRCYCLSTKGKEVLVILVIILFWQFYSAHKILCTQHTMLILCFLYYSLKENPTQFMHC
jgi:hypothetical protein